MYLRDLAASLLRRWYLVSVAAILTFAAGFGVLQQVGPTYEMTASVVLVPPTSTEDPGANRYLALSGLSQAVSVVIRALNSDQSNAAVDKIEPQGKYVATPDYTTSAPLVVLTATGSSPAIARSLLDASLRQIPTNLARLQDQLSIGQNAQITSIGVSRDDKPTVVQKKRLRLVAALSVLLLGGFAVSIGAIDGALVRRREERDERLEPEPVDPIGNDNDDRGGGGDEALGSSTPSAARRRIRKRAEAAATGRRRNPASASRRPTPRGSGQGDGPRSDRESRSPGEGKVKVTDTVAR